MRSRGAKSFVDDLAWAGVSYSVEQPPHCDLLRLSPPTWRFVRRRRAHLRRRVSSHLVVDTCGYVSPTISFRIVFFHFLACVFCFVFSFFFFFLLSGTLLVGVTEVTCLSVSPKSYACRCHPSPIATASVYFWKWGVCGWVLVDFFSELPIMQQNSVRVHTALSYVAV